MRSPVPEDNSAVFVEQVHAKLQAVENGAKYVGIVGEHVQPSGAKAYFAHRQENFGLKICGELWCEGVEQERHSEANYGVRNALPALGPSPP